MEYTELVVDIKDGINIGLNQTKLLIERQTIVLSNLLINKISSTYKNINRERLQRLFNETFVNKVIQELENIFVYYENTETEFYDKNLKTADQVFNTLNDKRIQTIYLNNILKKIDEKFENIDLIFSKSIKEKINTESSNAIEDKDNPQSINDMFNRFVKIIVGNPNLSIDEADDLEKMAVHYYDLYKNDVSSAIKKFLGDNKTRAIAKIEQEMDKREIISGKNSAVSKAEKTITSNSLKVIEQLLSESISKFKSNAIDELKVCSSSIVDLIFKLLPIEYRDQKGLLEVIIDTNINERLGRLLVSETKSLESVLQAKDKDVIQNELYEEKRYKKIDDYKLDYLLVDKVYQDVLHEVRIAYDIPEDNPQSKRLDLVVLSESNSTKMVFKNLINNITFENERNLKLIIKEMHNLSQKAYSDSISGKQEIHYPKK